MQLPFFDAFFRFSEQQRRKKYSYVFFSLSREKISQFAKAQQQQQFIYIFHSILFRWIKKKTHTNTLTHSQRTPFKIIYCKNLEITATFDSFFYIFSSLPYQLYALELLSFCFCIKNKIRIVFRLCVGFIRNNLSSTPPFQTLENFCAVKIFHVGRAGRSFDSSLDDSVTVIGSIRQRIRKIFRKKL